MKRHTEQKHSSVVSLKTVVTEEYQAIVPSFSWLYNVWSIGMNLFFGFIGASLLLCLLPVMVLCVYFDSPGPIFYVQNRVGYRGRIFRMYKFRSVHVYNGQAGKVMLTTHGDPRVTRVGALLRKTHLDELPQFINILRGDMSLVGPRPEMLEVAMRFDKIVPHYRKRLHVKPGLTGWAQVMHHYVDTDEEDEKIKVDYDLYYVQNRSIRLDCAIIVRTIKEVAFGYGR